ALTLLTIAEISTFAGAGNAVDVVTGVRASVLVLALSLTHVLALWRPRAPLTAGVGWAAAGLAAVAALSAVATGATEPFELVTVPLALAVVVGQVLAGRPVADAPELPRARLAASRRITAGLALALLPSALVGGSDESLLRPVLALALGGAMGLGGAFLLSRPRWTGLAWPALGVGTLTVVLAAGGRIRSLLGTDLLGTDRFGPDTRLEAWLLPAVLLLIGIGAGAIAAAGKETATAANGTETTTPTPPAAATTAARGRRFGYGVLVFALVAGLLTELLALDYAPLAEPRVILLAWIFAAVHLTVVRFDRSGEGRVLGWVALGAAGVAVLAALTVVLPEPLELVTVPVGVALALGRLLAVRGRAAGASIAGVQPDSWWIALGLALGLLPSAFSVGTGTAAGDLLRPILVIGLGGVLAVSGAFLVRHPRWSPVVWPTVLVGLAAVATAAATRILSLLGQMPAGPNLLLEAWLLPAALLVAATGTTLTVVQRRADDRARHQPTDAATNRLGYGLLVVAIGGVLLTEVLSLGYDPLAAIRVTVLAWVFAALHLVVLRYDLSTWGRMLGWVSIGAAGLVVLAGWTRSVPDPFELATVPVGVALVLGRLLPARTKPGARASRPAGAASVRAGRAVSLWVTLGLAMALLPSAIVGAGGTSSELFRPLLVLVLGGTLAVAGAALVRQPRWSAAARPAAVVGLAAVGITAGARILPLLQETPLGPDARLEAWLLPALLIVVAAAACLVTAARRAGHAGTAPSTDAALRSGYGLIALAIVGTLAAEVLALGYAPLATIRVILLVFTFSALHIAAFWFDESRLGRMIAWVAIGAGGGAVVAGYANSAPATVEIVSVPLAIALLASGWLHLDAVPRARSWPWLAPGLLVLLAPPLLQDVTESALWRIVLLGLVATVVIVVGLVRKLQAPFVIGAIVLLVHGVAQLWPWISLAYGAVPWWLWLGAGGILLIVLAARYEQRIANFKAIALNISALR
ncbi:MAG TPA: hypothetical protein VLO00_00610, partial [Cryobacterium sp.]|nr:hypothetical protein [Cryobacterium sp.]